MEKLVYLLGDTEAGTAPAACLDLRDRLISARAELAAAGARRTTLTVADLDDPLTDRIYQQNCDGLIDATVSFWLDSLDDRGPVEEVLAPLSKRMAGYLVTESIPRDYETRDWSDGERSPGVGLVTTFPKPGFVDDETFYRNWHGSHTPLSLEIHPLLQYVRNSVARALTPGAPPYRAIVNETVASLEIAADPEQFYGDESGQKRATEDLLRFVDFRTLSTAIMSEYILDS